VFEKCGEELFVVDLHGRGIDGGDEFVVGCRDDSTGFNSGE